MSNKPELCSVNHPTYEAHRRVSRAALVEKSPSVYLQCDRISRNPLKITEIGELGALVQSTQYSVLAQKKPGFLSTPGVISVGTTLAKVSLRVAYTIDKKHPSIGIEFLRPDQLFQGAIRLYFQEELLGKTLSFQEGSSSPRILRFKTNSKNGKASDSMEIELKDNQLESVLICFDYLSRPAKWTAEGQYHYEDTSITLDESTRKRLARTFYNVTRIPEGVRKQLIRSLWSLISPSSG